MPTPSSHATPAGAAQRRAQVSKSLLPGQPGTRRWAGRYGGDLVCVRYRDDLRCQQRLVTVELVVERRPLPGAGRLGVPCSRADDAAAEPVPVPVLVRLPYDQAGLRRQAQQAGARWDPARKLWRMDRDTAEALGWHRLIVEG